MSRNMDDEHARRGHCRRVMTLVLALGMGGVATEASDINITSGSSGNMTITAGTGVPANIGAMVTNSIDETISNSTDTALTFDTETWDTDTMHSTVSNTSRLTFTTGGMYILTCGVQWAANATGSRIVWVRVNGTTVYGYNQRINLSAVPFTMEVTGIYKATANDYAECLVRQSSGGNLAANANTGTNAPSFAAVRTY